MEIAVRDLLFERSGRRVLDIPELSFAAGTVTALFGPNGAGKTTLLRLLAGLETPLSGEVRLGQARSARERALVSAVAFQEPAFLRGTVRQNLTLGLTLRRVAAEEHAARVQDAASETGITDLLDRPARALSAGEARRVNLARALALAAPVMLLDEPLAGVDRPTRRALLQEIPRLLRSRPVTALIVTHDREEAFRLADRIAVMVDGRVIRHGSADNVYRAPGTALVADLLGYTILEVAGRRVAVPPGGLRLGEGTGPVLPYDVTQVVLVGDHRHAVGRIGTAAVECRLGETDPVPEPGTRVQVRVERSVEVDG